MKTNPITTISDLLNKLVIEHGSAVIQEKDIALLREQAVILEKKVAVLESENSALEENNVELKARNQELENVNIALKQKIKNYEKPDSGKPLGDIETKILLFISEDTKTAREIAKAMDVGVEVVRFHLEELKAKSMVKFDHVPMGVGDIWSLEQDSRKYLIAKKLIS